MAKIQFFRIKICPLLFRKEILFANMCKVTDRPFTSQICKENFHWWGIIFNLTDESTGKQNNYKKCIGKRRGLKNGNTRDIKDIKRSPQLFPTFLSMMFHFYQHFTISYTVLSFDVSHITEKWKWTTIVRRFVLLTLKQSQKV